MKKTIIITTYVALTTLASFASAPASATVTNVSGNFNLNGVDTTRLQQLGCQLRPAACRGQNGPHATAPGINRGPGTTGGGFHGGHHGH